MSDKPVYFPYLDSIRGISVLLVLLHHFVPHEMGLNSLTGPYGVGVFFVLSGFLITRILLNEKMKVQAHVLTLRKALGRFYYRRGLRIFPVYYLLVFGCFAIRAVFVIDLKGSFLSFLFYFQNFYFYSIQDWGGVLSHTWSLAVEEQFYLLWPLLILMVPKRAEYLVMITLCAIDLIVSFYTVHDPHPEFLSILPTNCLSSFMVGAFLAKEFQKQARVPKWLLWTSVGMFVVGVLLLCNHLFFKYALLTFLPVCFALTQQEEGKGKWLTLPALQYLGKISYGIYLYHYPVYVLWPIIKNKLYPPLHLSVNNWVVDLPFLCVSTFALAYLSWQYFEKPILRFKDRV